MKQINVIASFYMGMHNNRAWNYVYRSIEVESASGNFGATSAENNLNPNVLLQYIVAV